MRYLLLFFLLALQTSAFGSSTLPKSDVEKALTLEKSDLNACSVQHFMYQGQYYDSEIELAYNRFRYYDPNDGRYISVDPIGLSSGEFGLYNYVDDPNLWTDVYGLNKSYSSVKNKNKKKFKKKLDEIDSQRGNKVKYENDLSKYPESALLPKKRDGKDITYTEHDFSPKPTRGGRDAKRIVVGSDGRAYYTNDHYSSFTRIR